jgi:hypothetical protein
MHDNEKEIILDEAGESSPAKRELHHMEWNAKKKRWGVRITVQTTKNLKGKRIRIWFTADGENVAKIKRDAIFSTLRALGLKTRLDDKQSNSLRE